MSFITEMHFNSTDNYDCPCRMCAERFAGCHSSCIKYIDWKQLHDVKVQLVRDKREQRNACYTGMERRNKSLGRKSINHGRKKKGS